MATDPAATATHAAPATGGYDAAGLGWLGPPRPARRGAAAALRPAATPIPPPLLAGGVALLDAAATFGTGSMVAALPGTAPGLAEAMPWLAALILPVLGALGGAYALPRLFGAARGPAVLLAALALTLAGLWLAAQALGEEADGTLATAMAEWFVLGAALLIGLRAGVAALFRQAAALTRQRAVLVGEAGAAERLAARLGARPDVSLRLVGFFADRPAPDGTGGGGPAALLAAIRRGAVEQVVLVLPPEAEARREALVAALAQHPVTVRLAPGQVRPGARPMPPEAGGLRMPAVLRRPMVGWGGLVKTASDYAMAALGLAVAAVPMALIALAIRLDSPGPVLFRQRRIGFNQRDFYVLKFRTMHAVASADPDRILQVTEGDRRITRVGALLRRTSLDELPQIFNVLRGEMSVIGPRPHAPGTLAGGRLFEEVSDLYPARHRVKPGLTGLAQVRGWRGPTETEEKLLRRLESDLEYIDRWWIGLDIAILLRTLVAVARMRNAW